MKKPSKIKYALEDPETNKNDTMKMYVKTSKCCNKKLVRLKM